jgi:hypothetical protein
VNKRLAVWFVKHQIKKELKRRGVGRRERRGNMGQLIGKFIGLDVPGLIGLRTKLGIVGLVLPQVVDIFTNDAFCAGFPKTCAAVKVAATWLTIAGLYGRK